MSVAEANEIVCKQKVDDADATNKPCIDFQPGDRWQIQDEDNQEEQENVPNLKANDFNNTRRSRRLRSSKSNDSAIVNGDNEDCPIEHLIETKNSSQIKSGVKDNETQQASRKRPLVDTESRNSSEIMVKKIKVDAETPAGGNIVELEECKNSGSCDNSKNTAKAVSSPLTDPKKDAVDLNASIEILENEDVDFSNEGSRIVNGKVVDSEMESDINKKENKVMKEIENKNPETDADIVEIKKSDLSADDQNDVDIVEIKKVEDLQNDTDIEIINLEDGKKSDEESDSEIQIISLDDTVKPVVIDFPSLPSSDNITLTAGYPYYNSLKEKISDFTAGDYKPVKFPHTGTLLLAENEVIIESPSLLVPLLIKESDKFPKLEGEEKKVNDESLAITRQNMISKRNFFQSSVGQFLINLGTSRVQEWYHRDMRRSKLRQLKSKKPAEEDLVKAAAVHEKRHIQLKEINAIFNFRMKQCKFCGFKSESAVVMEGHYLTPHLSPRREFKCNFCMYLSRTIETITFHYEAMHQKKAVIESNIPFHECVFCSFQSHLKTKVTAHMNRCRKHFFPSQNLAPPFDFEFPGVTTKPVTIADVIGHRRLLLSSAKNRLPMPDDNPNSAYARKKLASVLSKLSTPNTYPDLKNPSIVKQLMSPQTNLPPMSTTNNITLPPGIVITRPRLQPIQQMRPVSRYPQPRGSANIRGPMPRRPYSPNINASHLASSGISITPITRPGSVTPRPSLTGVKNVTLTPISVTQNRNVSQRPGAPQPMALFTNVAGSSGVIGQPKFPVNMNLKPLRPAAAPYQRLSTPPSQVVKGSSGNTFVVCEICDSYVKDLEELRTHMNWVHKVKIHPKMLVSRPPLNCQKCQWRFFTDQGLERHLLGAHGLVTTNMQEMANKNQDGGRCIICAAVFTYKLVSHMTQVHKVTLKPAHLSYKCTVCTATFTLYRLFESHVYNVHSGSANKRSAEEAADPPPPKKVATVSGPRRCKECGYVTENLHDHIVDKHVKECKVKLCHIEKCKKCLYSSDEMVVIRMSDFGLDSDMDEDDSGDDSSDDSSDEKEMG